MNKGKLVYQSGGVSVYHNPGRTQPYTIWVNTKVDKFCEFEDLPFVVRATITEKEKQPENEIVAKLERRFDSNELNHGTRPATLYSWQ